MDKPLILIVDDDPDFAEILRHILESNAYRITCCHEAKSAMAAIEKDPPALVITDLMMQSLDSGFTLARQIQEHPRWSGIPVIIITGVTEKRGYDFTPKSSNDLTAMHARAFLSKPIKPDVLLETIRSILTSAPKS